MARVVFLDTAPICGLAFELIEVKRGWFKVPSSRVLTEAWDYDGRWAEDEAIAPLFPRFAPAIR